MSPQKSHDERDGDTNSTQPQLHVQTNLPRLELVVEREAGVATHRRMVLDGDVFRVGSHPSNELVLTDPQVSRLHCQIRSASNGFRVEDTGSLNGTRVAGVRIRDADLTLPECRLELGQSVVLARPLEGTETLHQPGGVALGKLYGSCPLMRRLFDRIVRIAGADSDVLIEGESGTGKELIAAEIVQRSARKDQPLVIVDCGAISHTLIESELLGHARGAFTGAEHDRVGAFEAADGGTLFLDEVGELPLTVQPKLLRALAAREIRRMGENQTRKFNVRVIAATNRRLEREINHGRFREDLYFRLSVLRIDVPPLRERLEDLRLLIGAFLDAMGAHEKLTLFTDETVEQMKQHSWPGNVRELRNYIERVVLFDERELTRSEPTTQTSQSNPPSAVDLNVSFRNAKDRTILDFEKKYLCALLEWSGGNVSRAARRAKLDRMYLHRLLQRHGLRRSSALDHGD